MTQMKDEDEGMKDANAECRMLRKMTTDGWQMTDRCLRRANEHEVENEHDLEHKHDLEYDDQVNRIRKVHQWK